MPSKLNYNSLTIKLFPLLMLSLEAYFAAANKARVDALCFFLASSAFLLFVNQRYFFSGLLCMIAAETHPYGFTSFMYLIAYLVMIWPEMKQQRALYTRRAMFFVVGVAIGIIYYLTLHYAYLEQAMDLGGRARGNCFTAYFFGHRYSWRHLPELAIWVIALALFVKAKRWKQDPFLLAFLVLTSLSSLLLPRDNYHYIIYLYPPILLLILEEAGRIKALPWVVAGILVLMLPQYSYLFWTQREHNHADYIQKLKENLPEDAGFIYGHANAWFAFKQRDFHASAYFARARIEPGDWPKEFWVIENRELERTGGIADLKRGADLYEQEVLKQWDFYDGTPVRIIHYVRK